MSRAAFIAIAMSLVAPGAADSPAACFLVGGARASVYRLCRAAGGGWASPVLLAILPKETGPGFTWAVPFSILASGGVRHMAGLTDEGGGYLRYFDIDAGALLVPQFPLGGQPVGGDYYPRLTVRGATNAASLIDVPPLVLADFNQGVDVAQGRVGNDASEIQVSRTDFLPAVTAQHKVHNARVFAIGGKPEVFINDLGNPWTIPETPGKGVVHAVSQAAGNLVVQSFDDNTIVNMDALGAAWQITGLHARSSVQDPIAPDFLYVLTQEVSGVATRLVALTPESGSPRLRIVAVAQLPLRGTCPGEGGADVIALGAGRVLVTDRFGKCAGEGHMYQYELTPLTHGAQHFRRCDFGSGSRVTVCGDNVCAGTLATQAICYLPLRGNPRFTTAIRSTAPAPSGDSGEFFDVVSASNNWGTAGRGDVTVFSGLLRRDAGSSGALRVQPPNLWRTEHIIVGDPLSIAFTKEEDYFKAKLSPTTATTKSADVESMPESVDFGSMPAVDDPVFFGLAASDVAPAVSSASSSAMVVVGALCAALVATAGFVTRRRPDVLPTARHVLEMEMEPLELGVTE